MSRQLTPGVLGRRKKGIDYFLDSYANAKAGFSLRYISYDFIGNPVILVRRDSDNAEQSFTPTQISDGTLISFCGSGNGFVKTWYDQSGNNANAVQNTPSAQPLLVSSGSLILENTKPAVLFNGSTTSFQITLNAGLSTPMSFIIVKKYNVTNDLKTDIIDSNPSFPRILIDTIGLSYRLFNGTSVTTNETTTLNQELLFVLFNGLNSYISVNSSISGIFDTGDNGMAATFYIGTTNAVNRYLDGNIQSIILFSDDKTDERESMEEDMNSYYNIY